MPEIKITKSNSAILPQSIAPRQVRQRKAVPIRKPPPHPLRIERLPDILQWWDEERYWLIHHTSGLRVPGSWSLAEAKLIRDLSKDWDWRIDTRDRKVRCGIQLLSLAEAICKRPAGGEE
jgi:hypothetical protein